MRTTPWKKSTADVRRERLRKPNESSDLIVACLWPKKGENLGTTLRTCDAVGATLVIPESSYATQALTKGNTIGLHNSPYQITTEPALSWLWTHRSTHRIIGVELAHGAIPLKTLAPSSEPTVALLGHEVSGIPQEAFALCHEIVEIPMQGVGNSLNVSVAAALVLYRLKGWL